MRVAQLVDVRRPKLLADLNRRDFDRPSIIGTNFVAWDDMALTFDTQADISNVEVVANDDIDMLILTSRLQALLEWAWGPRVSRLTYTTSIAKYGSLRKVRHVLCDEIVSSTVQTTIGRMKPLASGLKAGMITVTIHEYRNVVTLECSNSSHGRLFGAWMAICLRLAKLEESREPPLDDPREGFLILQDLTTGLWLVKKESSILSVPTRLLYAEDRNCKGLFFNGAGEYREEDHEASIVDVIPPARAIMTARPIDPIESG